MESADLVVEVVVTLTDSDESGDHMVPWGVLVIKGRLSKPMRERVDTECRLCFHQPRLVKTN